jgi:hypothetical protein
MCLREFPAESMNIACLRMERVGVYKSKHYEETPFIGACQDPKYTLATFGNLKKMDNLT